MQFILTDRTFVTAQVINRRRPAVKDVFWTKTRYIIILRKSQVWPIISWVDDLHEDV